MIYLLFSVSCFIRYLYKKECMIVLPCNMQVTYFSGNYIGNEP